MKTYQFVAVTSVPATPEGLFLFHENPQNISRIAPPSLKVRSVECASEAVEGSEFRILASQFGMPINWVGRWERVVKPSLLIDVAVRSPFKVWRHSHSFEADGIATVMSDKIEYLLEGGMAGRLVSAWILPLVFRKMFLERHKATRRWFGERQ